MSLSTFTSNTALLTMLLLLGGCASTGDGPTTRHDRNLITREDIETTDAVTAYEVLERLKPQWLRQRPPRSHNRSTEVVVLVDNVQIGGLESLRDVHADNIATIRWLDSAQAGQLPGLGSRHALGAILVDTR